jgi:CheY-like chemotaxis protein
MRLAGRRTPGAATSPTMAPAVRTARRSADSGFPVTRPMTREAVAKPQSTLPPRPSPRAGVVRLTDFGGLDEMPSPPSSPATRTGRATKSAPGADKASLPELPRGEMLLVAESLVEGRILHKRFKKYGLNIDWSREAKQALVMMQNHAYRLVVIDRLNGDPDALQVCRAAKQKKGPKGAPVVFMFAPTAGSMDRVKAGLAGSDAYLSRSVGEADLYRTLAQHRLVSLDGFARTDIQ